MQQLALFALVMREEKGSIEREDRDFRSRLIAFHLGDAKAILDKIDNQEREGDYAPELSEEEMLEYQPYSAEEAESAIDMLRRFGVAVE